MRKIFALVAALAITPAAFAQVTAGSESGAQAQTGPSTAIINQAPSADRLKTVGTAFMAGNAVSSGIYTCFGTNGAAVGAMGASAAISGTKEQVKCIKLHVADFGLKTNRLDLVDGALCSFEEGRESFIEAGIDCPADRRAGRKTTMQRDAVATGPVHSPQ